MARRSHRRKRVANEIRQLPWRNVVNPYAPIEILSADQVETIVQTSLKVLAKQGMRFLEPGAAPTSAFVLMRSGNNCSANMSNHRSILQLMKRSSTMLRSASKP